MIHTIVGKEDGLGVENLTRNGAIASAYSKAYHETFTVTYVTGRTVGIGAYLARLGMRCIQRLDQPIILTGFSALNKLLDREVYNSHMQLGGPKIMATSYSLGRSRRRFSDSEVVKLHPAIFRRSVSDFESVRSS